MGYMLCRCDVDSAMTRHVAFLLFWMLIFFLSLIALNALISIMGNSYQNLQVYLHPTPKAFNLNPQA